MSLLRTALVLGRVSNLPTVWTNVAAGLALGGGTPVSGRALPLALAMSLLYVGGMYLNDAFDHRWDAQHRPERPIPSGAIDARSVFVAGFGMLGAALALLALAVGPRSAAAGLVLAGLVVVYDMAHKRNPVAPLLMGLCRVGIYATSALAVTDRLGPPVWIGSGVLLAYLIVLTIIARRETQVPRLRGLVPRLIAGIALLDGVMLLLCGQPLGSVACVGAFVLTRRWQRRVPGT